MKISRTLRLKLGECFASGILVAVVALNIFAVTPERMFSYQEPDKKLQESEKPPSNATVQPSPDCDEVELLRKKVQQLSVEVDRLSRKVSELEKYKQLDFVRDQLNKEEQRAEALHVRLRENLEKQIKLQARLDELDQQLRPENIERLFTGIGSVRPEEARDSVRRRITTEKQGIQAQLDVLRQERSRLQASLATADLSIQRLRGRISEIIRR
jgi:chromosome segregation ATPase